MPIQGTKWSPERRARFEAMKAAGTTNAITKPTTTTKSKSKSKAKRKGGPIKVNLSEQLEMLHMVEEIEDAQYAFRKAVLALKARVLGTTTLL